MERLTINEVIEHCKRKVDHIEKTFRRSHLESESCGVADIIYKEYWEHRQVAEWLKELQELKDKQEQGLLIELPCKVGDKVYGFIMGKVRKFDVTAIKLLSVNGTRYICAECHCVGFFRNYTSEEFGETVFLTRSEAEEALAKMGE